MICRVMAVRNRPYFSDALSGLRQRPHTAIPTAMHQVRLMTPHGYLAYHCGLARRLLTWKPRGSGAKALNKVRGRII
jgi:hypothetical protein